MRYADPQLLAILVEIRRRAQGRPRLLLAPTKSDVGADAVDSASGRYAIDGGGGGPLGCADNFGGPNAMDKVDDEAAISEACTMPPAAEFVGELREAPAPVLLRTAGPRIFTTLNAVNADLASATRRALEIEDPVEYAHGGGQGLYILGVPDGGLGAAPDTGGGPIGG